MPVLIFRIICVCRIIFFMLMSIPAYLFQKIFKSSTLEAWLSEKLLSWAKFCIRTLRIDLSIKGQEKLAKVDWSRPVIVIANHSSYADIPALLISAQRPLGFLAKIELSRIPILHYWMKRLGCVFIKRHATGAGQKFMDKVSNYSPLKPPQIVIFPEGTRSKTGEMGVWKTGAFRMAAELKATILPIALQGTAEGWERRKNSKTVQKAIVQILEPIDVAEQESKSGAEIDVKVLRNELFSILDRTYGTFQHSPA